MCVCVCVQKHVVGGLLERWIVVHVPLALVVRLLAQENQNLKCRF